MVKNDVPYLPLGAFKDGAYFTKNTGAKQVGKVKITRVRDLALLVDGCWLVAVDMV